MAVLNDARCSLALESKDSCSINTIQAQVWAKLKELTEVILEKAIVAL